MYCGDVFGYVDRLEVIFDLKCNGIEFDILVCINIIYIEWLCFLGNEVGVICGEFLKLWLGLIVNVLKW